MLQDSGTQILVLQIQSAVTLISRVIWSSRKESAMARGLNINFAMNYTDRQEITVNTLASILLRDIKNHLGGVSLSNPSPVWSQI